jgi:ligand-binding sensor domain-containing protein/signal transduction histidine kinase/DNA-binding response OmpR family regulator
MCRKGTVLGLLLLVTAIAYGSGQNRDILFKNIANEDGLSHSTIFTILQDSTGYLWFGTQDGLNRYDGYYFERFAPDSQENSVLSTYIRALHMDRNGCLWIGGDKGISRYDEELNQFETYDLFTHKAGRYIVAITETSDGVIWAASQSGKIYRFSRNNNAFEEQRILSNQIDIYAVGALFSHNEGLLIGTDKELLLLNTSNLTLSRISGINPGHPIRQIVKANNNTYWIGTEGAGVFHTDPSFAILNHYEHDVFHENSLCNDNVRSLCFDDQGHLWIGTFIGLSILDVETQNFQNHYEEFARPYALTQNSVRSIFKDRMGGMWLGTFFGGLDYYHPDNIKFDLLNQNGGALSLSDNVISAIAEDDKENFWILTNDKGLNYWNRNKNQISVISHNEKDPQSLSSNNLKSIAFTKDGKLLIGTHNSGLNYYDPVSGRNIRFYQGDQQGDLSDNSVYALLRDSKDQLWIGTWKGLNRFNEKTHQFTHHYFDSKGERLSSDQISCLYEDSRKRIWIGTFNGVNIFYPERNSFETFLKAPGNDIKLSNNEITSILEDSKGRIWIGTRMGLNLFDELERNFLNITTKDGLPSNIIYGILEDDNNKLWISTNGGLSSYNTNTKKIKNYDVEDGIQGTQFNNYSYCKAKDGKLLFGGINGITLFDPSKINGRPFNPHVIFTHLQVFNEPVLPNDQSGLLSKSIGHTESITLKHDQNVFSIGFAAINFISADKINYYFKLEGYDLDWRLAESSRQAYYSNIPPGDYLFKVRAGLDDTNNEMQITQLNIEVLTPWWESTLAYILYSLFLFSLMYLTFRYVKERIHTQNQLRLERLEKHKITEVNKLKLQFFTNISHEFRTPLTLIISPLQKILERQEGNEWLTKQHRIIYKNARRLMNLIDQLMDFRKSELGQLKLHVAKGELVSFINEIYLSFALAASQNNIIFTFDAREEKIDCLFDKSYLEKIAYNLLSNAFKYTPEGGTIGIQLYMEGKWIVMEVKDSGKGIPPEKLSLIFERFYRIDESNSKPGSGIGLALTKRLVELHHGSIEAAADISGGSVFTVRLPLSDSIYQADEISEAETVVPETSPKPLVEINEEHTQTDTSISKEGYDTILIVEDNPEIVQYIKENLENNYNVLTASDGKKALEHIYKTEPTLIVSDIMMPVMDGLNFCKTIKQNLKTCHIPVILLTAKTSNQDHIEGLQHGADDYIMKPFEMNLLEAKIRSIIKTRKRLKEIYSNTNDIKPEAIAFNNLDKELLEKAKDIVENHIADAEFSVDLFAQSMGMSRSNLHLKMKSITGASATDFIKKIRFNKALELLEENRYSVAEISYMTGFNSPSYFSTSFKKHFDYLPTEHLQKRRQQSS